MKTMSNISPLHFARQFLMPFCTAALLLATGSPAESATIQPDQVSGLQLWLEARSNVDVDSENKVTRWHTLAGSIDAVPAIDAAPVYAPSGGPGGGPAIQFSGGSRLTASGIQSTTESELTAFVVVSLTDLVGNQGILDDKALSSNNPGFYLAARTSGSTTNIEFRVIDIAIRDTVPNINHSLVLPSSYDGENIVIMARISANGTTTLRIGDLAETTIDRTLSLTNIKGTSNFTIGAGSTGAWGLENSVSSVVLFNRALSDSEAEGVYDYLYQTQVIPEGKTASLLGLGVVAWMLFRRYAPAHSAR